jgi:membrane associated rhomboid family serine protease
LDKLPSGRPDSQEVTLERFLDLYSERPPVTIALLVVLVLFQLGIGTWDYLYRKVPLWYTFLGEHTHAALVTFGARSASRIAQGELWRLVSSGFVHGDALHLLVNGLALLGLGRLAEAVFGPARFVWIFLLSIAGGTLAAQMAGGLVSFGASGGLLGLMGALMSFGWSKRRQLPQKLVQLFGVHLLGWTLLNLIIGVILPFINSPSHVGGLLMGLLLGVIHRDRLTQPEANALPFVLASISLLGLVYGALLLG